MCPSWTPLPRGLRKEIDRRCRANPVVRATKSDSVCIVAPFDFSGSPSHDRSRSKCNRGLTAAPSGTRRPHASTQQMPGATPPTSPRPEMSQTVCGISRTWFLPSWPRTLSSNNGSKVPVNAMQSRSRNPVNLNPLRRRRGSQVLLLDRVRMAAATAKWRSA